MFERAFINLILSENEMRAECKATIESFEHWARRLLQERLTKEFGADYFNYEKEDGSPLFKKELINRINGIKKKSKEKNLRYIDSLLIEDIIYILCREDLYKTIFKEVLDFFYKNGRGEVSSYLNRIIPIRNKLNHANCISNREAEQAICYSNDFIDCLKEYYKKTGSERKYNVPTFTKISDSLGNSFVRDDSSGEWSLYKEILPSIRAKQKYKTWVEIDPSFNKNDYDVLWRLKDFSGTLKEAKDVLEFEFEVSNKQVGGGVTLYCILNSHKDWHKHRHWDDFIKIYIPETLPPIEDNY